VEWTRKNTLNVFQIMAEFCVPLHQKWKVTKQIVREIYIMTTIK